MTGHTHGKRMIGSTGNYGVYNATVKCEIDPLCEWIGPRLSRDRHYEVAHGFNKHMIDHHRIDHKKQKSKSDEKSN